MHITKRYPLRTPTIRGIKSQGWLEIRPYMRSFEVQWDFGSLDWRAVDESYLFPQLLEVHRWQDELRSRLNAEGWHLGSNDHPNMKWQTIRPVSEELALWVAETLPALVAETTEFFEARFPDGISLQFHANEAEKAWDKAKADFAAQFGSRLSKVES